jgi:serine/threonine protein kinase
VTDLETSRADLLSGRYALGEVIGRGGMGVVHRAWDFHLQRYVAVKILRGLATGPVARARFHAEGKTLARLSHPGLITLLDAQTEGDEPYLVMELVDGESLAKLCRGRGMELAEVVALGTVVAEALDHVHRRRIIHRDITPGNVLIGRDGRVKLADFGLARLIDGLASLTATGMALGTAGYLSPEQVRLEPLTVASDIYSFGLVLLEALSGEPAFDGSWDVVALARLTISPRIDESLPATLRGLFEAMTDVDPVRRPTAAEVAITLRSLSAAAVPSLASVVRRFDEQPDLADSADFPISSRLESELSTVPGLDLGARPPVVPPRSRSRLVLGGLIAAAVIAPALLLVPAFKVDWPDRTEQGNPSAAGPSATGSVGPQSRAIDPNLKTVNPGRGAGGMNAVPDPTNAAATAAPGPEAGAGQVLPIIGPTGAGAVTASATPTPVPTPTSTAAEPDEPAEPDEQTPAEAAAARKAARDAEKEAKKNEKKDD